MGVWRVFHEVVVEHVLGSTSVHKSPCCIYGTTVLGEGKGMWCISVNTGKGFLAWFTFISDITT